MSAFLRLLGLKRDEGSLAAGLFVYSLLLGVGRVFVLTASQALFLEFYPASDLAYVYMIAAVATIATSAAYLRLGRSLAPREAILANLGFALVVTVGLRVLFGATGAAWPAMALAAWFHVLFALSSFAFWGAATQVLDIRQGKRLFPVVTTGDVVAFSVGGFVIMRSVDALGTANLLWIGAGGLALAVPALFFVHSRRAVERRPGGRATSAGEASPPIRWSSPYLRWMTAYFVLSAIVFIFLDNAFNDVAQRRYDGAAALARFFATYSAVAAIVNFGFRSLLAGRLVRRFGLILGLTLLPATVGAGAASVGLSGTLLPGLGVVFWLTVLTRLSDKVLRGVQEAAMGTLYQPLGDRGPAVQTAMQGIVDSAAIGLAGAALLGLHSLWELTAVELSWFLLAFCAAWIVVAVRLKSEFVEVLSGALERRRLGEGSMEVVDGEVLSVVRGRLESEDPAQVVYALRLITRAEAPDLPTILAGLLRHPAGEVRLEALRRIEALAEEEGRDRFLGTAREACLAILEAEGASGELGGAAARALAALADEVPEAVWRALDADDPAVRRGAMVGLLRSGSIEGVVEAGAKLLADLESERPEVRAAGAEVLRDAAIPSFRRHGMRLLEDPDPRVRARAVEAAAAMDHPALWPRVVEALEDPELEGVVSRALLEAGSAAAPFLVDALLRALGSPARAGEDGARGEGAGDGAEAEPEGGRRTVGGRKTVAAALRILGLVGGEDAAPALLPLLERIEDRALRTALLRALRRSGASPGPAGAERIRRLTGALDRELREGAETLVALAALGEWRARRSGESAPGARGGEGGPADAPGSESRPVAALRAALEEELRGARHRIFLVFALLSGEDELVTAWENYDSGSRARRAYALELLDSHLSSEDRGRVFPLLEELENGERLELLGRPRPGPSAARDHAERLAVDRGVGGWTRLCARRAGPALGADVERLEEDEVRLFDRTLRLGRVELFRSLPAAALARTVPRLRLVEAAPGVTVIRKGEEGDSMYVVLEGRVRVDDDGRELAVLERDQVFGEFTVLQRARRTASVTALEDVRLLRLDAEDLQALMREDVEVARSLMRVILRRLRS